MKQKELRNLVRRQLREGRIFDASRTLMRYRVSGAAPSEVIALSKEVQRELDKRAPQDS